jgi:hypothetical protein
MVDENRIAIFLVEFDYQTREIDRIFEIIGLIPFRFLNRNSQIFKVGH